MAKKPKAEKNPTPPPPLTPAERKTLGKILKKARAARSYNAFLARKQERK